MGGIVGGWMGQWVNGWCQVKWLKQLDKSWFNQDNSIVFEDLWFVETPHPGVGVLVVGCVSGSMGGSGKITNNLINLDIIWRFIICRDTPTHGWVHVRWMGGSVGQWEESGHIAKYWINLDLIEIMQFCLKIYDLLRHPHLWVCEWINGWVNGWCQVKWLI